MLMSPRPAASRRYLPSSPFSAPVDTRPVIVYEIGERVTHDRHGLGRVLSVEETSAVVVEFKSGARRVILPSAQLTKL